MNSKAHLLGLALAASPMLASGAPARAQTDQAVLEEVKALRREVDNQRTLLEQQQARIEAQQHEIEALKAQRPSDALLAAMRGAGMDDQVSTGGAPAASDSSPAMAAAQVVPASPVGEAPPEQDVRDRPAVQAVPEGQGVLTPAGNIVFDPQIEYVAATTNRLVFRGIELIPGIQIGAIEASDVDRDTLVATGAVRFGLTNRLEAEIRVPYLYRRDRIEVVQQRDEGIVRVVDLKENGIGDVEFALRYQLNRPRPLHPIWILQARVKSNTGRSPFEIPFDEFGVATGLSTGSGFWGVQPGISFLLPSDPVVIYGGMSYLWHLPGNVNKDIGEVFVGRVDPGDSISANLGFGFAVNPRFSFSLGYRHTYIWPTVTELGDTTQRSNRAMVGAMTMGLSYRVARRQTMNFGFSYGVTQDSPDVSISLRMPFQASIR